jgi:hypothetical protein
MQLVIPCSPEQEDVIADHLLAGAALGVLPDERAWMFAAVRKLQPTANILSANLDLVNAQWVVEIKLHK